MRTSVKLAASLLLVASTVSAQPSGLNGTWMGRMASSAGQPMRVDLVIKDAGGTLRLSPSGYISVPDNVDQCHNRDIPVELDAGSGSALNFVVRGDKSLRGCFKGAGSLKLVDAKSLDGTLKDGRIFKLIRQ